MPVDARQRRSVEIEIDGDRRGAVMPVVPALAFARLDDEADFLQGLRLAADWVQRKVDRLAAVENVRAVIVGAWA
jgi:hypothetical protein